MAKTRTIGLESYRSKRDFTVTPEPPARSDAATPKQMFVVQKHAAHRAGLHWDFRLEHNGVLWSWAVPKGPSLDPADKRMAIHVEDHPVEYADFAGNIPTGQYGGGHVELWDRGTWEPIGNPDDGMRKGELKFLLAGQRLNGRFVLVRLRQRDPKKPEAWLLIKERDEAVRPGGNAPVLEYGQPADVPAAKTRGASRNPPAPGAVKGRPPANQAPQLSVAVEEPPNGDNWISEIKFDGYRLLAWVDGGKVRLVTRNGHDWADRLPAVVRAVGKLQVQSAVLDGELVALLPSGASSFPQLQEALSAGLDRKLFFYAFDLLELNGWDLRSCKLIDRKAVLEKLNDWNGMLRISAHVSGNAAELYRNACAMQLEGIVSKKTDAPYRGGRGHGWIKVKCLHQDEFIVLGWTPPGGSRTGLGALHVGYFDPNGRLHYAGGVGTGFSERELTSLRKRLDDLKTPSPPEVLLAGDPLDPSIRWVLPELVAEVQYPGWSGAGRLRHTVYLGLREDKSPADVIHEIADAEAERQSHQPVAASATPPIVTRRKWKGAVPPLQPTPRTGAPTATPSRGMPARIVVAKAPRRPGLVIGTVEVTHPNRELWPGITKQDLAEYWLAVADRALPGLAHRLLSVLRCPDGIQGEQFFQKNGHGHLPLQIREGTVSGAPYLAIDDADGLVAMAQMSAIELHAWGAAEIDPLHPDQIVFDLDPGEGVAFDAVVRAAHDVRNSLQRLGLMSFCRTTGGKGLHIVAPLTPKADWDTTKKFCRSFAEALSQTEPSRFLAHLKIADRGGRILIDWLRNGMGATAVASFSPRARPGATVATPIAWDEVKSGLDPSGFTIRTVPERLKRLTKDPWNGFSTIDQTLPNTAPSRPAAPKPGGQSGEPAKSRSPIVVARKPTPRR